MNENPYSSAFFESVPDNEELRLLRIPKEIIESLHSCKDTQHKSNISSFFIASDQPQTLGIYFEAPVDLALLLNDTLFKRPSSLSLQWVIYPAFFREDGHTTIEFLLDCRPQMLEQLWQEISPEELSNEFLRLAEVIKSVGEKYEAYNLAVQSISNTIQNT